MNFDQCRRVVRSMGEEQETLNNTRWLICFASVLNWKPCCASGCRRQLSVFASDSIEHGFGICYRLAFFFVL
ncbi:hypothetical protein T07_6452 [Trichinella nelsoni]|uniref:Uncharacterized protein n=1 Tax=Trichinella nelsoni TaxID=6336 RepID=A0A0V0SBQ4_9BILA|nr:hypothetical protein T07_6452 [Trichinella nelsoni]